MKKIVLSKLTKLEMASFALEVIRIVSQYDFKKLLLDGTYQVLTNQIPNIKLLEVPYKEHHLTKSIAYYNKMCLSFAATINSQISLHNQLIDKEKLEIVQIAYLPVKMHFDYLGRNNRAVIHRTIESFFIHLNDNPEVREALDQLGLGDYLEMLHNAHIEYKENLAERLFSKSQRPKIDSKAMQHVLERLLQLLFTQIDCYQHSFSDLNYKPLVSELNVLISEYVKNINMHAAFNKRKALEKKQAKEKRMTSAQDKEDDEIDPDNNSKGGNSSEFDEDIEK